MFTLSSWGMKNVALFINQYVNVNNNSPVPRAVIGEMAAMAQGNIGIPAKFVEKYGNNIATIAWNTIITLNENDYVNLISYKQELYKHNVNKLYNFMFKYVVALDSTLAFGIICHCIKDDLKPLVAQIQDDISNNLYSTIQSLYNSDVLNNAGSKIIDHGTCIAGAFFANVIQYYKAPTITSIGPNLQLNGEIRFELQEIKDISLKDIMLSSIVGCLAGYTDDILS